ncbi:hypothetical protein I4U23_008260 [Adineta vaga]|nr:hypothetical protein I4U23_008260 [Adineta vaga]
MSVLQLYDIRKQLGYYGIPVQLVFGNIGNLFTVLVLRQTLKQRINSCALYLFCASIANWLVIDTVLISTYYGIDHIEPIHTSNVLCKLRWYAGHVLFMGSRNFMIVACIDRWAVCSQNVKIRMLCRPKIAYRLTTILIISTLLMPVHLLIFFDNNTSGQCSINLAYNLAYTIFAMIAIGILPPFLMILFTYLAHYNLRRIRSRVQLSGNESTADNHIHKRDYDLMKMLVGEVILFCITTSLYPINTMYNFLTIPVKPFKSPLRVAIEALIGYIVHPLLSFTYCCTQFYVYMFFSKKFRDDFLKLFRRRFQIGPTTMTTERTAGQIERNTAK